MAGEPRLQLGAGPHALPGWLNSDLISGDIYLDLGRRLPLPDQSFTFATRRRSDLGTMKKLIYPVLYGGRPRFWFEPRLRIWLHRSRLRPLGR
ncbi:MAG: hypothetical protein H0U32_09860 [Thermoleophilaceae bacterium]|nr:hypothetical protein [Thermoleophilaceae bacterium]